SRSIMTVLICTAPRPSATLVGGTTPRTDADQLISTAFATLAMMFRRMSSRISSGTETRSTKQTCTSDHRHSPTMI
ncbi:hypothetical protein PENTCL1PPCAC_13107, partial [Pristionchus entomophagus]